mgnify:CR=1 FL=1
MPESYTPPLKKYWDAVTIPPHGWSSEKYFEGSKDHKLRYGYAPAYGDADHETSGKTVQGTVVLTHGYGENIDLYYESIKEYQKRGYDVFAMDFHGQGRSGRVYPDRPRTPSTLGLEQHVADLDIFIKQIVLPQVDRDKPLIMSTNSMGAHVGMLYMNKHQKVFDAAVMSAPMFDIKFLWFPRFVKPAIRFAFNMLSKTCLRDLHLASKWDTLERWEKAPLSMELSQNHRKEIAAFNNKMYYDKGVDVPTIGWVTSTFETSNKILNEAFLKEISTPILIGSAGNESFVDNRAHDYVCEHVQDSRRVIIPGANHTIWLESDENLQLWWSHIDDLLDDVHMQRNPDYLPVYIDEASPTQSLFAPR